MSSRSKMRAASFGFMFSYIETMPLKRFASALSRLPIAVLIARFHVLELGDLGLQPLLGGLEQALAHVEVAAAGIELLAAVLQALEDGALAGRGDLAGFDRHGDVADLQLGRLGRLVARLERRRRSVFRRLRPSR